jgi:hypothetical protein
MDKSFNEIVDIIQMMLTVDCMHLVWNTKEEEEQKVLMVVDDTLVVEEAHIRSFHGDSY